METDPSSERLESETTVQYLERMRDTGYLFHGSGNPNRMEVLEPRKANDSNSEWNSDTAIYASSEPVWSAVFAVYKGNFSWRTSVSTDEEGRINHLVAYLPESYRPKAEQERGYVYVLPPETFERESESGIQHKSKTAVRPIAAVEVTLQDYYDMGGQVEWTASPEKPKFLYHASPFRDIQEFEPRAQFVRDPEEGPVVFATPSEIFASMFIVRTDDRWSHKGRFNGIHYTVINDRQKFEEMDKGGSIYVLPSETFSTDEAKSMGTAEWTSKEPVKPSRKTDYESGLDAMLQHGVQVYFVDADTWRLIEESDDHGLSVLSKQQSENDKRGINYIPLNKQE